MFALKLAEQLLEELRELRVEENLGNLSFITSKAVLSPFLPHLKSTELLGQNSKVDTMPVTKIVQKVDFSKGIMGAVFSIGGKSVFSMAKLINHEGDVYADKFDKGYDRSVVSDLLTAAEKKGDNGLVADLKTLDLEFKDLAKGSDTKRFMPVVAQFKRLWNDHKIESTAHFIHVDVERASIMKARAALKKGLVPLPSDQGYARYIKQLKSDLERRFKNLKLERVENCKTDKELIDFFIREGYFKPFVYAGFHYEYSEYTQNVSLQAFMKHGEAYVGYKIVYSALTTPEEKAAIALANEFRKAVDSVDLHTFEHEYDLISQRMPPSEIKVVLQAKGGLIMPVSILAGQGKADILRFK